MSRGRAELAVWQRIRRYAVPAWMIERAARARLAGDWAGACAAGQVEVGFTLRGVARDAGAEVAEAVEDDLRHLAPDLLRWHLPRDLDRGGAFAGGTLVLRRYERHALLVTTRRSPHHQRPRLHLGPASDTDRGFDAGPDAGLWLPRARWDVRHAGRLAPGGVPFLTPAGGPLPPAELGAPEQLVTLQERGETRAAWALAGFDLEPLLTSLNPRFPHLPGAYLTALGHHPVNLAALPARVRAVAARAGQPAAVVPLVGDRRVRVDAATLRVGQVWGADAALPVLSAPERDRLVDGDLVRAGAVPAGELHPAVTAAMFPRYAGHAGPPVPVPDTAPVRVRCMGEWHTGFPHTAEDLRREETLLALGGVPHGCFAVRHAWGTPAGTRPTGRPLPAGRLPKALRARRAQVVFQARFGDEPGLAAWLDAGLDPHLRDGEGRTLLHMLAWLPSAALLPRLLDAGLDLAATDLNGRTPLQHATDHGAHPDVLAALRTAAACGGLDVAP